jgi:uncharacterized protein YdhG (YjbR/CyaY superfamily)
MPVFLFGGAFGLLIRTMAKTDFKSIDEYIDSRPQAVQGILRSVRSVIRKALPAAEEVISYQIPAYRMNDRLVLYFAGWKQHYSLYPASEALVAAFTNELAHYVVSKGTIRFPLSEPVPIRLIQRIAKFRAKEVGERDRPKRARGATRGAKETQLERVRRICGGMPRVSEKLSHGAPAFFVEKDKGVFTMFVDNHHSDGHLAVWLPAPPGLQAALITDAPKSYFKPPYVGSSGWIGIELNRIDDEALAIHVREAWELAAPKKKKPPRERPAGVA